jgi:ribose transport system substrate-binding protein
MNRFSRWRTWAVALAIAVLVGACSGQSTQSAPTGDWPEQPVTVDLGSAQVEAQGPPKRLAIFIAGSGNYTYAEGLIKGAQDAADEEGIAYDVFQADFDPQVQYNQVQNAISSGKYDIFALQPANAQMCSLVGKEAAGAGIVTTVLAATLCGTDAQNGDALWSPGTLNMMLGGGNAYEFTEYLNYIIAQNPGNHHALLVSGPDTNGNTKAFDAGVKDVLAAHPEFKTTIVRTDFSTPDAFTKVQNALQGSPDIDIVYTQYVDLTVGAINAAEGLGRAGNIKFYDFGASKVSAELVESGKAAATYPEFPYTAAYKGVQAIFAARRGEDPGPRVQGKEQYLPGSPTIITQQELPDLHVEW